MMWPLSSIAAAVRWLEASAEWQSDAEECSAEEQQLCRVERIEADKTLPRFERVDVRARSSKVKYANGKTKRTRYAPVDLSGRRVVLFFHQMGFERSAKRMRETAHKITCHGLADHEGTTYEVHPPQTRLVAANRADRSPWHAISFELLGNFERIDGTGTWWQPDRFGRGRATDVQLDAAKAWARWMTFEVVPALGGVVVGAAPHSIAGRNRWGKANRQACCGSRAYAELVEWCGAELNLAVPAPDFELGGIPVDPRWYGRFRPACSRFLTKRGIVDPAGRLLDSWP